MIPAQPINLSELVPLGDSVNMFTGEFDGQLLVVLDVEGGKHDGVKYYVELDQEAARSLKEAIELYQSHGGLDEDSGSNL